MERVGWRDNNIEDFVEKYGINEELTAIENYEKYKLVTDEPYSKNMFTRYLTENLGYQNKRLSVLGKRNFYYRQ